MSSPVYTLVEPEMNQKQLKERKLFIATRIRSPRLRMFKPQQPLTYKS